MMRRSRGLRKLWRAGGRVETRRLVKIAIALASVTLPYALVTVNAWAWQMGWAVLLSAGFPGLLWAMRFSGTAIRLLIPLEDLPALGDRREAGYYV